MAYAYNEYTGTTNTDYLISFAGVAPGYLHEDHVLYFLNGVLQDPIERTFIDATHIQITAPLTTDTVRFQRSSSIETPLVDWEGGAGVSAANLDTNTLQMLYVAQEAADTGEIDTGEALAAAIAAGIFADEAEASAIAALASENASADEVTLAQAEVVKCKDEVILCEAEVVKCQDEVVLAKAEVVKCQDEVILAAAQVALATDEKDAAVISAAAALASEEAALAHEIATGLIGRELRKIDLGDIAIDTDLDVGSYDYFIFKPTADITVTFINVAAGRVFIAETTAGSAITWATDSGTLKWDADEVMAPATDPLYSTAGFIAKTDTLVRGTTLLGEV